MRPPAKVAMGRVRRSRQFEGGIQDRRNISARSNKKGASQRDQSHKMGQEIESKGEQDINIDNRYNPFPIKGGHDEGKEKKAHNQDQPGKEKVTRLLP